MKNPGRFDLIRKDSIRSGKIRSDPERFDPIRKDSIRSGKIRSDPERFDPIRKDSIRSGKIRSDPERFDLIKTNVKLTLPVHHTSKAQMIRSGAYFAFTSRAHDISGTILVR